MSSKKASCGCLSTLVIPLMQMIAVCQPLFISAYSILGSNFMQSIYSQDDKPAPGWVALDARESKRQIRLPSPPVVEEPRRPAEPAVFRPPPRKKPRTRWHEDAEGGWPNGEQTVAEYEPKPATPRGRREEGQIAERQREVHAKPSRAESTQVAEKRKPSPQVLLFTQWRKSQIATQSTST